MFPRVKTVKTAPTEKNDGVATEYALIATCFVLAIITLVCVIAMSMPVVATG